MQHFPSSQTRSAPAPLSSSSKDALIDEVIALRKEYAKYMQKNFDQARYAIQLKKRLEESEKENAERQEARTQERSDDCAANTRLQLELQQSRKELMESKARVEHLEAAFRVHRQENKTLKNTVARQQAIIQELSQNQLTAQDNLVMPTEVRRCARESNTNSEAPRPKASASSSRHSTTTSHTPLTANAVRPFRIPRRVPFGAVNGGTSPSCQSAPSEASKRRASDAFEDDSVGVASSSAAHGRKRVARPLSTREHPSGLVEPESDALVVPPRRRSAPLRHFEKVAKTRHPSSMGGRK